MKKKQLQKILRKNYIRLPLDETESWPKTKYVKTPSGIPTYNPEINWELFDSEEDIGKYLKENYPQIGEQIVGKMKVNLSLMNGEYAALRGDVLQLSWWKDGAEISFEDLYAIEHDEDDLEQYPIQLTIHLERMVGEWEYCEYITDDLEVCRAIVLGIKNEQLIPVNLIDNFFSNNSWLDEEKLNLYIEALANGASFPPIELVEEDDKRFTCYDGHHRLAAHKRLNRSHILAKF